MPFRHAAATAVALILALSGTASAGERPVVVELFTSQGCSSCPPAEALLRDYVGRRDVLPLGFHVTYWDRLGWRDPFAFEGATARQATYAGQLGDGNYTPQMVIDGRYSAVGSRAGDVSAAIRKAAAETRASPAVALARTGGDLSIRVGAGSGSARILLVGFDHQHTTPIGRGENGGRTITQANVVRSLQSVGSWSGQALELARPVPAGQDAAVLLQAADGRIVGAARL